MAKNKMRPMISNNMAASPHELTRREPAIAICRAFGKSRERQPEASFVCRSTTRAPAFILLVAAYVPSRIRTALKHPMLAAVKLWALAHLIANGDLASLMLFGSFLAYGVFDRISVKRRAALGPLGDRQPAWKGDDHDLRIFALRQPQQIAQAPDDQRYYRADSRHARLRLVFRSGHTD